MKAERVALPGILLALNMIVLFGATMLPGIELTLFGVSSIFTAIVLIKISPRVSLVFYIGSALLGLVIMPNKLALIPYIIFFGYYGVVKYCIEKTRHIKSQWAEYILKAIVFLASFGIGIFFFKEAVLSGISLPDYPMVIIGAIGVIVFLIYDFAFTIIIAQLKKQIK